LDNRLICGPDGRYTIDFDDFEKKASDPRARLFLLCSPHNPTGRVWTREELEWMSDLHLVQAPTQICSPSLVMV
jgi:cystathionine beta-lyase